LWGLNIYSFKYQDRNGNLYVSVFHTPYITC